jgi:hypothetical protein
MPDRPVSRLTLLFFGAAKAVRKQQKRRPPGQSVWLFEPQGLFH